MMDFNNMTFAAGVITQQDVWMKLLSLPLRIITFSQERVYSPLTSQPLLLKKRP